MNNESSKVEKKSKWSWEGILTIILVIIFVRLFGALGGFAIAVGYFAHTKTTEKYGKILSYLIGLVSGIIFYFVSAVGLMLLLY